jgi:hypothetical protein
MTNYSRRPRRTRIIPADQAGYMGHAGYVVQYWSTDNKVWGDVGDPVDTMDAACAKEREFLQPDDDVHTYSGPPCPRCGVPTDDEGDTSATLTVCMNVKCIMFSRYVEVKR